jgi:hypothetical protein
MQMKAYQRGETVTIPKKEHSCQSIRMLGMAYKSLAIFNELSMNLVRTRLDVFSGNGRRLI